MSCSPQPEARVLGAEVLISAKKLLRLAPEAVKTTHILQQPLDSYHSTDGHLLVVGDAAHIQNVSVYFKKKKNLRYEKAEACSSQISRVLFTERHLRWRMP